MFAFHCSSGCSLDSPLFCRICWYVAEPLLGLSTKSSFRDSWAKEGVKAALFLFFRGVFVNSQCSFVQTAVYQYGGVDLNGQVPSFDRSLTPLLPSDAVDPSVCYVPNAYQQPFYYGGTLHPKTPLLISQVYRQCLTKFLLSFRIWDWWLERIHWLPNSWGCWHDFCKFMLKLAQCTLSFSSYFSA